MFLLKLVEEVGTDCKGTIGLSCDQAGRARLSPEETDAVTLKIAAMSATGLKRMSA